MQVAKLIRMGLVLSLALSVAACGGVRSLIQPARELPPQYTDPNNPNNIDTENTIWNVLNRDSGETEVRVNRYIWAASLEVLNFLPVQQIDSFTGVIVTGYGTPPGGGRAYRATILIDDPALDARSLNVALQTRSGPAAASTVRAVEDAILNRARQLRIADNRL